MMKSLLLLAAIFLARESLAQSPWYFGVNEAVNLTPGISYSNGVKNITGSLNPSSSAVNAPAGSLYMSTSVPGLYVKQDSGSSTNWSLLSSGSGDVVGPASAVNNGIVLFDGTTGKLVKSPTNSGLLRSTGGAISFGTAINMASDVTGTLGIANGGTNSSTALSGSSIMISNGTSIVQGDAGTTTTVLHGNASGAPTYGAVALTSDVSGVLPVANGGSNKALTLAAGGVVWTDADSFEVTAAGSSGQLLQSNGTSAPSWSSVSLTEVMSIPGATNPEFVSYTFTAGTSSVNECTTGTCAAYAVSGSGISSVAWTALGRYTVTFDATYSIVNCSITAWAAGVGVGLVQAQGSRPSCKSCSSTPIAFWRGSDESFRDAAGVLNCVLIP